VLITTLAPHRVVFARLQRMATTLYRQNTSNNSVGSSWVALNQAVASFGIRTSTSASRALTRSLFGHQSRNGSSCHDPPEGPQHGCVTTALITHTYGPLCPIPLHATWPLRVARVYAMITWSEDQEGPVHPLTLWMLCKPGCLPLTMAWGALRVCRHSSPTTAYGVLCRTHRLKRQKSLPGHPPFGS